MLTELLNNRRLINQASIYICSVIALFGVVGNFVSFLVFIRSGRRNPRIVTRNLLLLLTITNSTYLILYWLYRILPRILDLSSPANFSSKNNSSFNLSASSSSSSFEILLVNKNNFSCRFVTYMINVAICLNASVTVFFSIERALAINFPFETRDLRENYKSVFKYLLISIFIFSFIYPIYNFVLIGLKGPIGGTRCDVLPSNEQLYFILTLVFVLITLAIPFLLISVSNLSVLIAVYKSNRNMVERMGSWSDSGYVTTGYTLTIVEPNEANQAFTSRPEGGSSIRRNWNGNTSKVKHRLVRRARDKNSQITTMLIAISASFVLLNFPYFLAWCNYAYMRVASSSASENHQRASNRTLAVVSNNQTQVISSFAIVKITEAFNMLNYAINGFLYFSTGKLYRQHLFYLLGCKYSKPGF